MEYIILAALWIAFCAIHSALISITATEFMKLKLGEGYRFYRLFYNIFTIATLIPVVLYTTSIYGEPLFQWSGYLRIAQVIFISMAVLIIIFAAKEYDLLQTIGIRQIMSGKSHRVLSKGGEIKETGILGMVRHPFYSAVFLFLWAGDLSITAIIVNVVLSGYLVIGTILEERKLVVEFGDDYTEYKKSVSMFFPYKWLVKKFIS